MSERAEVSFDAALMMALRADAQKELDELPSLAQLKERYSFIYFLQSMNKQRAAIAWFYAVMLHAVYYILTSVLAIVNGYAAFRSKRSMSTVWYRWLGEAPRFHYERAASLKGRPRVIVDLLYCTFAGFHAAVMMIFCVSSIQSTRAPRFSATKRMGSMVRLLRTTGATSFTTGRPKTVVAVIVASPTL